MKSITISVALPGPELSPNARKHWRAVAPAKRVARDMARLKARMALSGAEPPRWKAAKASVVFYWPNRRKHDPDNAMASLKATWDGLQDAGIVENDSGIWPERPVFSVDPSNPRVVITLEEETK